MSEKIIFLLNKNKNRTLMSYFQGAKIKKNDKKQSKKQNYSGQPQQNQLSLEA
jgi:hypothetical protein